MNGADLIVVYVEDLPLILDDGTPALESETANLFAGTGLYHIKGGIEIHHLAGLDGQPFFRLALIRENTDVFFQLKAFLLHPEQKVVSLIGDKHLMADLCERLAPYLQWCGQHLRIHVFLPVDCPDGGDKRLSTATLIFSLAVNYPALT